MRTDGMVRRGTAAVLLVCVSAASSGCSLLFTSGPPSTHARMTYFHCTESSPAPVYDAITAAMSIIAVPSALLYGYSALRGFRNVRRCRAAKLELGLAIQQLNGMPEGMRADASMAAVHVAPLVAGDTLRVGVAVDARATALTNTGAEIAGRVFLWSSSNQAVVTVDSGGKLNPNAAGTALITARTGGVVGVRTVVVVP